MTDDKDAQIELLTRALVFVFATGTELPFATSLVIVQKWATALYALGVRHDDTVLADEMPPMPQWLQAAAKEQVEGREAIGIVPADGAVPQGFASVMKAPKKRAPRKRR
jgi:hypothetical protein